MLVLAVAGALTVSLFVTRSLLRVMFGALSRLASGRPAPHPVMVSEPQGVRHGMTPAA
jgi:hypothetical protein